MANGINIRAGIKSFIPQNGDLNQIFIKTFHGTVQRKPTFELEKCDIKKRGEYSSVTGFQMQ